MKIRIDTLKRQVRRLDATILAGAIDMDEYQRRLKSIIIAAGSWERRQEVERVAFLPVIHRNQ